MLFDPALLLQVAAQLERCDKFVGQVRSYAQMRHAHLTADGDPDALRAEIVTALNQIATGEATAAA